MHSIARSLRFVNCFSHFSTRTFTYYPVVGYQLRLIPLVIRLRLQSWAASGSLPLDYLKGRNILSREVVQLQHTQH